MKGFFVEFFSTNSTALSVNIRLTALAITGLQVDISQTAPEFYLHYSSNHTNTCS